MESPNFPFNFLVGEVVLTLHAQAWLLQNSHPSGQLSLHGQALKQSSLFTAHFM